MKPTFYRKSKRFSFVSYPHTQIKVTIDSLRNYIADVILDSGRKFKDVHVDGYFNLRKFDKDEIINRLSWMKKSRLIGIFYMLNMKDATKALKEN